MPALTLLIVLGTRPEAIKLLPVLAALRADPAVAVELCVTGQHRELVAMELADAGVVADHDLAIDNRGGMLDALTVQVIARLGALLRARRPDRVIVQGDTATAAGAAVAAFLNGVPVAHVEAGLRSHDLGHPWPEEGNRRIIAALADLHFAPTRHARDALIAENIDPAAILVTGNTAVDAVLAARAAPPAVAVRALAERFAGRRLVVVTAHRRESHGAGIAALADAIARFDGRGDLGFIVALHPNPAASVPLRARLGTQGNVALADPLPHRDFIALLDRADVILTDSGGIQEEAPSLGVPVVVLRACTERVEALAAGTARLAGLDADGIARELTDALSRTPDRQPCAAAPNPFGDGHAAARIAAAVHAAHGLTDRKAG